MKRLLATPAVLLVTVAMELVWGTCLILNPSARRITALTPLADLDPAVVGLGLLAIGAAGVWAITTPIPRPARLWALLPAQALFVMAASAGVFFALSGRYGDGVPRPELFIFADQFHLVALAIGHTIGMLKLARRTL